VFEFLILGLFKCDFSNNNNNNNNNTNNTNSFKISSDCGIGCETLILNTKEVVVAYLM
jgi:hypothetical protein